MALFSRKSKSKRSKESTESRKEIDSRPTSSHRKLSKSQPVSRSNSLTRVSSYDMTSHPAYAQNDVISASREQSYLPVPPIPIELQNDKESARKAARVLGIDPRTIHSAPGSPRMAPQSIDEKGSNSRHDSVNSNVDKVPHIGRLTSEQEALTFAEELAIESAYYNATGGDVAHHARRSVSSAGHERNISDVSFRSRRHTMHQSPRDPLSRQNSVGQVQDMPRGRPHRSIPSYSMPINASRPYVQAEQEQHHSHHPSDATITYHSRNHVYNGMQEHTPSPMRSHVYHEDVVPRNYTPQPLVRIPSRQSTIIATPLAILEGFKINRRGKILDEEGDAIGELVEGDILDCVRQKCNANGEVVDEYGRVVGRVRTLVAGLNVSSPALRQSPAVVDQRPDYFNLQPHASPMMAPVEPQHMQRRADEGQKYRILMDVPPVPSMPVGYKDAAQSPALNAKRHTLATYDQFDGTNCVELPADEDIEPLEAIPVFDLSEPFMPPPTPTVGAKPDLPLVKKHADEPSTAALPKVVVAEASPRVLSPKVKRVSSDSTSDVSTPSSTASTQSSVSEHGSEHTSSSSISSIQSEDRFEDAVAQPAKVQTVVRPDPTVQKPKSAIRSVQHPMQPRIIVPVSQLTQTAKEESSESTSRPTTAVLAQQEPSRPFLASRAKTAPAPNTNSLVTALPPVTRADTTPEIHSTPTSGYASAEESLSEGESVESVPPRKGVRISNLPPTTIPNRGLSRTMSDGSGLTRFNTLTSVPESAPLLDTPRKSALLSPSDAAAPRPVPVGRQIGPKAAPLPAFPRGNFTGSLGTSPFAAANAANNHGAGLQKRSSMPNRPNLPAAPRAATIRNNRYTLNAPLVPSPLSDHRKTISSTSASSISSQSSRSPASEKDRSDAISIISSMSTGRSRTYFTHAGRVTVEAGDLPPSLQKKDEVLVTEIPLPEVEAKGGDLKKRRFSMKLGRSKK